MALTKISGNQISPTTEAIIEALSFTSQDSVLRLPSGTTGNQPTGVAYGTVRYNTEEDYAEIYVLDTGQGSPGWKPIGSGGVSLGSTGFIRCNTNIIQENVDIDPATLGQDFSNAFMAGPVQIAQGYEVEVAQNANFYILGEDSDNTSYENVNVYGVLKSDIDGRIDMGGNRRKIRSYRATQNDDWVSINMEESMDVVVTGISRNFRIDVHHSPTTNINIGQENNNWLMHFRIWWYNGSTTYRPTGYVTIGGVPGITQARFYGNYQSQPRPESSYRTNTWCCANLYLLRFTEYGEPGTPNGTYPYNTDYRGFLKIDQY
jgi:hypothetical protein